MKIGDSIQVEVHEGGLVDDPKRRTMEEAGTDERSLLMQQIECFEKSLVEARKRLEALDAPKGRS